MHLNFSDSSHQIKIVDKNFTSGILIGIILFLTVITLIKLGYFWGHKYTHYLPESSLLLFVGIGFGYLLSLTKTSSDLFTINTYTFMYLLLPPIVLESAFAMYHFDFMTNIVAVLIFAIIATLLNFILLSALLWVLFMLGVMEPSINEITILLFCALITSIDPVAVLAIFQEIHVDNNLYYLVFGESLLNDGVAVVLYNCLKQLARIDSWEAMHYFKSTVSFLCVAIGGGVIGFIFSSLTCLMSRFAYKAPLSEPIIVFGMSMIAYLVADILGWSVIISMIMFGLIQVAYNFHNITHKSLIIIKRLAKILANLSESIIFLCLGVTLFDMGVFQWSSSFALWSLFLCIYIRFIVTFILSALINKYELAVRELYWTEQYIIAYGGMRGGISYCLAVLLEDDFDVDRKSIIDATILIIIFTVVVMGITIGPLVKVLDIKIAQMEKLSLIDQINDSIIIHTLATIEAIAGLKGRYSFYEFLFNVNTLFVRPLLQRTPANYESRLLETYKAIDLRLYMAYANGIETEVGKRFLQKFHPNLKKAKFELCDLSNAEDIMRNLNLEEQNKHVTFDLDDSRPNNNDPEDLNTSQRKISNKALILMYQKNLKADKKVQRRGSLGPQLLAEVRKKYTKTSSDEYLQGV